MLTPLSFPLIFSIVPDIAVPETPWKKRWQQTQPSHVFLSDCEDSTLTKPPKSSERSISRPTTTISFPHFVRFLAVTDAVIMGHKYGCEVPIILCLMVWITGALTIHNVIQQHVVCCNRWGGRRWPCLLIRGWSYDYRSRSGLPGMRQRRDCRDILARTWWRHQMETFSALLAICAGNSPVPGEFPAQRPVTRSFYVFFDLHSNKRLSEQWWAGDLWHHRAHYDVTVMMFALSHSKPGVVMNHILSLWQHVVPAIGVLTIRGFQYSLMLSVPI